MKMKKEELAVILCVVLLVSVILIARMRNEVKKFQDLTPEEHKTTMTLLKRIYEKEFPSDKSFYVVRSHYLPREDGYLGFLENTEEKLNKPVELLAVATSIVDFKSTIAKLKKTVFNTGRITKCVVRILPCGEPIIKFPNDKVTIIPLNGKPVTGSPRDVVAIVPLEISIN
jgi:hypothetical protein